MERRHIKWFPLVAAALFLAYQYFSSEKFVNPETGRKSHVAMSVQQEAALGLQTYERVLQQAEAVASGPELEDRKSTRLNSSHRCISYAVFCLKKKKMFI